jgi:hypothetical protein
VNWVGFWESPAKCSCGLDLCKLAVYCISRVLFDMESGICLLGLAMWHKGGVGFVRGSLL